ncbi:transposase [Chryseobacterium sp. NRRL B-14859]|uniref:transposase n=1 Tax=Chryseobacterium sp. NRRL B-14859 TaxID=1562763 RepID=UPI00339753C3
MIINPKVDFKNIHIGTLVKRRVAESGIEMSRICNFFKCTANDIDEMYNHENLTTDLLLKWSKLLEYDFFRIYSQHLILFSPQAGTDCTNDLSKKKDSILPKFRKNIYTKEIIDYILEIIDTGEMTKLQVIERYRIPKTTLQKWIQKYNTANKESNNESQIQVSHNRYNNISKRGQALV